VKSFFPHGIWRCELKIFVGTSGYGYKAWKGKFYPAMISAREMLRFYSENLDTVEINNTFYHMPTEKVLTSWALQVPANFVFFFKAPQIITHLKRLKNVDSETEYLLRTLSVLGTRLGPVLFQFPKSFPADLSALKYFLTVLPRTMSFAFEFRHPSWQDTGAADILREKGCSLCLSDLDEAPVNEIVSTATWGYLRLRRAGYTNSDLAQWMKRILAQEWKRAFVYFKHEEEAKGPKLAMSFRNLSENAATIRNKASQRQI
jgi:uncharacterized protein YecE (DUF72 family)